MIKEALDVWMWMFNIGLSGNEVLIYAYIYDCSSRGRVFKHSYQEIADSIGSSEQTVRRAIDKMLKLGAIKRSRRKCLILEYTTGCQNH